MPADPDRIAFVQQDVRRAVAIDAGVQTAFGALARESADPIEAFFDNVADAQVLANARLALFSPVRRRMTIAAQGLDEAFALDPTGGAIPNATVVDTVRAIDRATIITDISIDLASQQAQFGTWG